MYTLSFLVGREVCDQSPEDESFADITYTCLTLGSVRYNYTLLNGPLPQGLVKYWVLYRV